MDIKPFNRKTLNLFSLILLYYDKWASKGYVIIVYIICTLLVYHYEDDVLLQMNVPEKLIGGLVNKSMLNQDKLNI